MTGSWTFFTNHAHVLSVIWRDPDVRLRDVADRVGITERAAQRIVAELEESGILTHEKVGRRNRYHVVPHAPLRHPIERHVTVDGLMELFSRTPT